MKNISIKLYFDKLDFEFIETYSFKRGPKLDLVLARKHFNLDGGTLVMDELGQFDETAEKIATIRKGTREFEEIDRIINKSLNEVPSWMCAPFYRDALLFRSKDNQIIDTLNICFECSYMQNMENFINADEDMYKDLQILLNSLGHNIGQNESNQLREKIKELKNTK